jgi:sugar phosphate isomerase/epimerase
MPQKDWSGEVIRIGFSMHPRWASADRAGAFLEPLRKVGLTAVEFELDSNDPHWREFPPLVETCRDMGLALCFHAPYRPPHTIAGFADGRRDEIIQSLSPIYDVAARYGPSTVVIHGAKDASRSHALLYGDTVAFLQWVLQWYGVLTVALENLNPDPAANKVGCSRAEVGRIAQEVRHPRLGICWDVGHDVNVGAKRIPGADWLRIVRHVHIHDLDERGLDHYPLIYGQVAPERWLPPLVDVGFSGTVTLELNGERCGFLWPDRIASALAGSVRAISETIEAAERKRAGRDKG